jgi:hypothetical protein
MHKKSVISLISYDAEYLPESIRRYYDYVDEIVLGLDEDRISWSGNPFSFDEDKLWNELNAIDKKDKIVIITDNFHKSSIPIENDNYERNFLKEACSHDIIISIDADEWLLNAKDFFHNFLPIASKYIHKYDICMNWAIPYKTIGDTTLIIANEDGITPQLSENQGFVTHKSATFTYARWTDRSQTGINRIMSPLIALHYSLCRSDKDLEVKINNIGHSDIAKTDPFITLWRKVDLTNYMQLHNFKTSGLGSIQWPRLLPVKTEELSKFYLEHGAY